MAKAKLDYVTVKFTPERPTKNKYKFAEAIDTSHMGAAYVSKETLDLLGFDAKKNALEIVLRVVEK